MKPRNLRTPLKSLAGRAMQHSTAPAAKRVRAKGGALALSGVDRLLHYARDLGVEPSRPPRRAAASETPATRKTFPDEGDGIRLSLSSRATAPQSTAAAGTTVAASTPAAANRPEETAPLAAATSAPREAKPNEATPQVPSTRGSAVDAYQRTRQGAALLGQRIAIRA